MKKLFLLGFFAFLLFNAGIAQTVTVYNESTGLSSDRVKGFSTIDNDIWVGEGKGCSRYDGSSWEHFTWIDMNSPVDWIHVYGFVKDNNGDVWAAGQGGVFHYDWTTWTNYYSANTPEFIYGDMFNDIEIDDDGVIWVLGTNTVDSYLYSLDPDAMTWTSYDLSGESAEDMRFNDSGILVITSVENGFTEFDGTTFTNYGGKSTFGFGFDESQGIYWTGSYNTGSGLYKYDSAYNQLAFYNASNSMMPCSWLWYVTYSNVSDFEGVWYGGSAGFFNYQGVGVYDDAKNFFLWFDETTGLNSVDVQTIYVHDNQAWLGTNSNGAMHIDFATSPFLSADSGVVVVQVPAGTTQSYPINIINKGGGNLSYAFDFSNSEPWLSSSTTTGTIAGTGSVAHEMTFDATDFSLPLTHETNLKIESNGGIGRIKVIMEVTVPIVMNDVTFVVTDGAGAYPLEDALVELDGVQQYTDASGETTFNDVLTGIYPYTVTKDGYFGYSDEVGVVDDVTVDVSLWQTDTPTALNFDGADDYVQTTCPGVFGISPRTFKAWIYLEAAPSGTMCISDYGANVAGSRNTFIVNGSGYLAYLAGGSNAGVTASVATVPVGEWVHVAFVYDGANGFLYQNGEQVGTGDLSGVETPTEGENLKIGQRVAGGSIPFNGLIDELSIWDEALTQQEIIDYACVGNPAVYNNLVAYYDFNDGMGTTLTDLAGGFDGTLMNMAGEVWITSNVCGSGYNISFVVTETPGGNPVEDALVDMYGITQTTNGNGETTFANFSPGTYAYSISKDGYVIETGEAEVIDDDVLVEVELVISSIGENAYSKINIHPNPANDKVIINASVAINKVIIYNNMGQLVKEVNTNSTLLNLNVSDLENGVYYMKVFSADQLVTKKMLIQ